MSRWGKLKVWTPEAQIRAIQAFYTAEQRWPTTQDFQGNTGRLPHFTTVYRTFGTLAEARRQAGMPGGGPEGHGGGGRGGGGYSVHWAGARPRATGKPPV